MVILLHAWEKMETGHGPYLLFLVAGLVFLAVAILHPIIEKKAPWIDGLFFVIEAMLTFSIALEYFHLHKKWLPWSYVVTGLGQLLAAVIFSRKGMKAHREHKARIHQS